MEGWSTAQHLKEGSKMASPRQQVYQSLFAAHFDLLKH